VGCLDHPNIPYIAFGWRRLFIFDDSFSLLESGVALAIRVILTSFKHYEIQR